MYVEESHINEQGYPQQVKSTIGHVSEQLYLQRKAGGRREGEREIEIERERAEKQK